MNVVVVGTGYVGLVTGTCFAEMGCKVTCVDIDHAKIEGLHNGVIPIYEPGLEEMVKANVAEERLFFTNSLADALPGADFAFIAVGTPPGEDGSADLKYVLGVAREIGQHMDDYLVVVDKSTVPVGTADKVRDTLQEELDRRGASLDFDVVSNPEFLKEGDAIDDFMRPDRVVIGAETRRATELMHQLYAPFMRNHDCILTMGIRDAEMTKYAANAMLATKISFMNEIASMCEQLDVDVEQVRLGIGSDSRIGYSFIYPGCGYGGSCFPKDVKALVQMANDINFDAKVLRAVEERNDLQKHRLAEKIIARFGADLSGLTIGLWGLAFKPGTDDMREAPSIIIMRDLIAAGANLRAYDPVAMTVAHHELPNEWFEHDHLKLCDHPYDVLQEADAMALVTEWKPFRSPDFSKMKEVMKQAIIFDGRNQYDPAHMTEQGFEYHSIGRTSVKS
jgi:UDPglucose 6-dehydrogenase